MLLTGLRNLRIELKPIDHYEHQIFIGMKFYFWMVFFMVWLVLPSLSDDEDITWITNHTFLFLSGWPQSGTSLLQQIITESPYISSM